LRARSSALDTRRRFANDDLVRRGRLAAWRTLGPLAAALALALLRAVPEADACIVLPSAGVLPGAGAPAPRNTRVWAVGLSQALPAGATLTLVASRDRARPVPLSARLWETSGLHELWPASRLEADERYELWATPRGAPLPRQRPRPPVLVGTFRTGSTDDVTPPSPPRLTRAERVVPLVDCAPFIAVEGVAGADASGEVLHAVWFAEAGAELRYGQPPARLERWSGATPLERAPRLELHGLPASTGRLGVRAVDVAGNLSDPVEIEVVAGSHPWPTRAPSRPDLASYG
jgi:hypothetical protein